MYVYEQSALIEEFLMQLQVDLGMEEPIVLVDGEYVVGSKITHALCWKEGRILEVAEGGDFFQIKISSPFEDPTEYELTRQRSATMAPLGPPKMKYVVVTGGVLSGIGKGITASSIGVLLKAAGLRVTAIKIDPYLNVDAGTMSPYEHGETFVLDDGGETDLDLGNYERFLDLRLHRDNNLTTGKVYKEVIDKERRGDYLGKTVQVLPHITDCVQSWLDRVAHVPADGQPGPPDVCVIELGGTVGDIESAPYVEALRQFQFTHGVENFAFVHVSLVPIMSGEQKTKPTQHTVRDLRSAGIAPDLLVCRSSKLLDFSIRKKLAMFTQVAAENVVSAFDVTNIYQVPLVLHSQGVLEILCQRLSLHATSQPTLTAWRSLAERGDKITEEDPDDALKLAFVGKYTSLADAYQSVFKAIEHSAMEMERRIEILLIEASDLEPVEDSAEAGSSMEAANNKVKHEEAWDKLRSSHCVLVPGGFGDRGTEGKVIAVNYARTNKVPFLGICLGMQLAVVEFARNQLGWRDATSEEFDKSANNKVVVYMPEISKATMGGNMRLGTRKTLILDSESLASKIYGGKMAVDERHRHRYEVNPEVAHLLSAQGLKFVGQDETGQRMEIVEIDDHPFYFGCQYHPEFKSRPGNPSPVFMAFAMAAQEFQKKGNMTNSLDDEPFR
eukprot:TRINITY_DN3907_c0_g1_i1.p1 TRINITY_DN3907_c0_g1~~TRINITY_DN3907_c0_g1_i1.p1  ORF type:complete len:670 (-),score=182.83 TRINITY_DN3907_c0_g1_i1:214-2223(-)